MAEMSNEIKVFNSEGFITLGLLRLLVEETWGFDDSATVRAGMDDGHIDLFDTIAVQGEFDVEWVPIEEED